MVTGRSCPLCDGAVRGEHRAREMMFGLRDRFLYGECRDCGSLVLLDPPADLGPYYPPDYYSLSPRPRSSRALR